jgi:hypothetical protein
MSLLLKNHPEIKKLNINNKKLCPHMFRSTQANLRFNEIIEQAKDCAREGINQSKKSTASRIIINNPPKYLLSYLET